MSKIKTTIIGALACSTIAGLASPIASTFAEGSTSFFDLNAKNCIIDSYNEENGTSIAAIEEVDFSSVTELKCANRNIVNFYGITLFPNLEKLDLSNNYNLQVYNMNFSQNTKLKEINVKGTNASFFDFRNNPDLESIESDSSLYLDTIAYVEKKDKKVDGTNYQYSMDLSVLKFLDSSQNQEVLFKDRDSIEGNILVTAGGHTHRIYTRGGWMNYAIYLNGDESVETHSPIYINNNCKEEVEYGGYSCNNSAYYGEAIDTNEFIANTLSKIFNLSNYRLSKVEIVPPTSNIELVNDTNTFKKGIILADANFTVKFYFDHSSEYDDSVPEADEDTSSTASSVSTPETGTVTTKMAQGVSAMATIGAVFAGITTSIVAYPKIKKMLNRKAK